MMNTLIDIYVCVCGCERMDIGLQSSRVRILVVSIKLLFYDSVASLTQAMDKIIVQTGFHSYNWQNSRRRKTLNI